MVATYRRKRNVAKKPVRRNVYRGSGAYSTTAKNTWNYLKPYVKKGLVGGGSFLGKSIGSAYGAGGAMIGAGLGAEAGGALSRFIGSGAYRNNATSIRSNSLLRTNGGTTDPLINNFSANSGDILLTHREYVGQIFTGPEANKFFSQKFEIQPGLALTFPWLSQIASNYEQYEISGMAFEFVSEMSDSVLTTSTSPVIGSVMMSITYDPNDPKPASKIEMESQFGSCIAKPSENLMCFVECKRSEQNQRGYYVRTNNNIDSISDYDHGFLNVASTSPYPQIPIGSLYATYSIILKKQKLYTALGYTCQDMVWKSPNIATVSSTYPMGLGTQDVFNQNILSQSCQGIVLDQQYLYFDSKMTSGTYLVELEIRGTIAATVPANAVVFGLFSPLNMVKVPTSFNNTITDLMLYDNVNRTLKISTCVRIINPAVNNWLTFNALAPTAIPTGVISANMRVTQIPNNF